MRRLWVAAAAMITFGGVLALIDASVFFRSTIRHTTEINNTIAKAAADQLSAVLEAVDLRVLEAVDEYGHWKRSSEPTPESGHRILARIQQGSSILRGIGWMNANGDLIASSVASTRPALNVADQPHFKAQRQGGGVGLFISAPFTSRMDGSRISALSRRMSTEDGRFDGIVTAFTDLAALTRRLETLGSIHQFAIKVVLADGSTLVELPGSAPAATDAALRHTERISEYGLAVEVATSRALALEPWRHRIAALGGLWSLLLVAVAGGVVWLRRSFADLRERERELVESDRRLNEAQRIAGIGSWELDLRANALRWSDEIFHIFELDPRGFAPSYEAFLDAIHPDDRKAVHEAYTRSIEERSSYHITHRLLMPDGRVKWVEERCETEFAPDGKPVLSRGTVQDVTELKRVEAAVKESQARLSGLLEIAPEGIIAADERGTIQLFNKGAELIFGYGSEEMIGRPIEMLIPERFRDAHRRHLLALADGPDASRTMTGRGEIVGRRRDGTEFPAEAGIAKLTFHDERMFTVIIRDVTERRQAERALLKAKEEAEIASRAKTEFLANMSHELRTPLNAILGFSEIVHQELLGPLGNRQYAEYCKDIHSAGSHLLGVINDILDLSRIETGHMEMADDLVEVDRAAEACLRIVHQRANENRLTITKDIAADFPPLRADERKLKQMLINLLSNAVKFTPAGGSIRISAVLSEDGGADICVADTGVGMNPEDVPRALRPFTQLDSRLSRRYEGAGLGLPLVKSLCELHGGALAIETREGAGTTVRLHFPPSRVVPRPAKLAADAA